MQKSYRVVALGLCGILAIGSVAIAGQKGGADTSTPATFLDDPLDRIRSDGHATYVNGMDDVKAIIDRAGDFDLDTNMGGGPTLRRPYLDFGAPASAGASPPFVSDTVGAYLSTGGGALTQMAVGDSAHARLNVNFSAVGLGWFIRFDPTQYQGTSTVLVSRVSADTWVILAAPTDIGKLHGYSTKGKMVSLDHGNFFLPFLLTVRLK